MANREDFNDILYSREKFGGLLISVNRVDRFVNCINYCKLINLGFRSNRFTWTNKRRNDHTILERIGCIFANYD